MTDLVRADGDAVIETVRRAARAFDAADWPTLRACLADMVWTDYSAFRGTPPEIVSAGDYVASRASALAGLVTEHVGWDHHAEVRGDRATCRSAYRITRTDPARADGANRLVTTGHYHHGLARAADGWRIDRIRQTVDTLEGERSVHGALRNDGQADGDA